ncbi:MAG: ABC transporter permease [Vicinamibacterales bacterium]
MSRAGWLIASLAAVALLGPLAAPYGPVQRFEDYLYAPPMRVHLDGGGFYAHPLVLVDRLEQRFDVDTARRAALPWSARSGSPPVLLLGADGFGRDVLSRVLHGARASLGLALLATAITLVVGSLAGAWAGLVGGVIEQGILRLGDVLIVIPALYAVVALRAALPLVLPTSTVVVALAAILVLLGWPRVARGVWSIVRAEVREEYVQAALALGASRWRIVTRHLLPACAGFLVVQTALLVPGFVLTEATLSYVGLGFPEAIPSWGTALSEAANVSALARAPWMLAPALAIFLVVLATNVLLGRTAPGAAAAAQPR